MTARGASAWIAVLGLVVAGGCAAGTGAVDLKRLPDAPVALLHRPEAVALERQNAIHDLEKRQQPSEKQGVVRMESLDALFGGAPEAQHKLAATAGHFGLFDPHAGEVRTVDGLPPGAKPLAWSPDRTRLLISGRFRDTVQLFLWDRASGQVEIVSSGNDHPMGCIGPAGRIAAVEVQRVNGQLAGRLVATPAGSSAGLRPVTAGPSDVLPACSPNSSLVAYVTAGDDGVLNVAVLDLDAPGDAPKIVGRGSDPVFTPDGAWIVYAAATTKGGRLVRVRPDGGGRTPMGSGESKDESHPAVSPDGAYVAYVGKDPDDRDRLRVRRFDGTGDRPFLTDGDADSPTW